MEYFVSHVGYIAIAAAIIALIAVAGWIFSMKNEEAKRKKINAALARAEMKKRSQEKPE